MAGTNPEPVLAQAGFVPLTPAEPCWFTPAEIWPMISASEGLNLIGSLCLTHSVGISQHHRPEAVANIPIPANLLTAAWQEAETLLGHHVHLLVGIAVRGHTTGFLEVGGLHGRAPWVSQFLPWQRQLSRAALQDKEKGFDPSEGSSSCLVWMCSWSGGAGEKASVGSLSASHHSTCVVSPYHITLLADSASLFFYC